MDRYALVRDGVVFTIVEWDGKSEWNPDGEIILLPADYTVQAGDGYDGSDFVPVVPQELTVTIGQVLDVAIQLGTVTLDEITKLLPFAVADVRLDKDGSYVVDPSAFDAVVAQKIAAGTSAPIDVLPVGADTLVK